MSPALQRAAVMGPRGYSVINNESLWGDFSLCSSYMDNCESVGGRRLAVDAMLKWAQEHFSLKGGLMFSVWSFFPPLLYRFPILMLSPDGICALHLLLSIVPYTTGPILRGKEQALQIIVDLTRSVKLNHASGQNKKCTLNCEPHSVIIYWTVSHYLDVGIREFDHCVIPIQKL